MLKKLSEPFVVGVASRLMVQVFSFATVIVASRYLDLEIFGIYALAWAATVIGNTFVFTGFYQALLRTNNEEASRDTLFWLKLAIGAGFALVIAGAGLIAGGRADPQGAALLMVAPIPILIAPAAWFEALLVRQKRVRAASLYLLISEAAGLAVAVVMLARGWQIEALIAARYTAVILGVVITFALVRILPRLSLSWQATREGARTALPLWGTTSVHMFTNYGTDIILGAFASSAVIGAYRGGARIAMTASDLVLQPLNMLAWSRFTRIEKEGLGQGELRAAFLSKMAFAAAILWPISAAVGLLAPELVAVVLDETWLPAASIVAILSLSRAVLFFSALLEPTLIMAGKERLQFLIRMFGAGTLLIALLAMARFGAEAAAWAHFISSVLVVLWAVPAILKALSLRARDFGARLLPGLLLTALVTFGLLGAEAAYSGPSEALGLAITLAVITLIWLGVTLAFLRRRILEFPKP